MNKLSELLSKPYINLEQAKAIALIENIEKLIEEQDRKTIKTKWFKTIKFFGFEIIICRLSKKCPNCGRDLRKEEL